MNCRLLVMLISGILCFQTILSAQRDDFRQFIESGDTQWQILGVYDTAAIKEFYRTLEYQPVWTGTQSAANRHMLYRLIEKAGDEGLEKKDYQFEFIQEYKDSTTQWQFSENWIITEVKFTDAALHYFRDIAFGNTVPLLSYNGISYNPNCISVPWQLAKHIQYNSLESLIDVLQPPMLEINVIRSVLAKLRRTITDTRLPDEPVVSATVNTANKPLLGKLLQLGILDSTEPNLSLNKLQLKVKETQRLFGLLDDGVIRSTFLKEINIPIAVRIQHLSLAINYYRWLYCLSRTEPVIVVNIPAAYLKVYNEGRVILGMRIIVGKPATPTPTLSSRIQEIILYPYWTVPHSIATKELLPSIKRNRNYIDDNNYQVLNKQGQILDPSTINWSALSTAYFPYVIRQSTGCDNALGLLKLNFYNPYSVYLHDTPSKSLFMLNRRYFSHGCMRLENPTELGQLVLGDNSMAIDTLEQKGCLLNQSPITVPVSKHLPVVVWYNPAGVAPNGRLVYYEDVYHKLSWMKEQ